MADGQAPDGEGEEQAGRKTEEHRHDAAQAAEVADDQPPDQGEDDERGQGQIGQDGIVLFDQVGHLAVVGDADVAEGLGQGGDVRFHRVEQPGGGADVHLGPLQPQQADHPVAIGGLQVAPGEAVLLPGVFVQAVFDAAPGLLGIFVLVIDEERVGRGLRAIDGPLKVVHKRIELFLG